MRLFLPESSWEFLDLLPGSFRDLRHAPAPTETASVTMSAGGDVVIGFLGGTGDQGRGLARRFALSGHDVMLGSRDAGRAEAAALDVAASLGDGRSTAGRIEGAANPAVAAACDPVVVAVPYEGHADLLRGLADSLVGKVVVDCVNPLGFDKQGAFPLDVAAGSAAEEAATLVPGARLVAAFHHVSAVLLLDPSVAAVDTDVLVLGDDREAVDAVVSLASSVSGMRGIYAGRLRNARQVEALTANLISINRRYKAHAGLRVTDV